VVLFAALIRPQPTVARGPWPVARGPWSVVRGPWGPQRDIGSVSAVVSAY